MNKIRLFIKYFLMRAQNITIDSIPNGSVIDIGGGGEGVIAQIGAERITAIDKYQNEIDEAKPNTPTANWVLADATDLPYSNDYFDNATAFFSGMYMSMETFTKVCKEVYRVLRNNGELWIWDAKITKNEDLFIIRLRITLPSGKKVKTGYGTQIKNRSLVETKQKLEDAKFHVEIVKNLKNWYFLKAIKNI